MRLEPGGWIVPVVAGTAALAALFVGIIYFHGNDPQPKNQQVNGKLGSTPPSPSLSRPQPIMADPKPDPQQQLGLVPPPKTEPAVIPGTTFPKGDPKPAEMRQKVSDATVYIRVRTGQSESSGSGFVVQAGGDQALGPNQ